MLDQEEKRCFRCLSPETKARLLDAIYENEMVNVCENCANKEDIPVIKKPTEEQFNSIKKNFTVNERLRKMSGLSLQSTQTEIKKIVPVQTRDFGLISNFNWSITRARRFKGLSKKQVAELIAEDEKKITDLEQGSVSEETFPALRKIEQLFRLNLQKSNVQTPEVKVKLPVRMFDINKDTINKFTISDLQKLKSNSSEQKSALSSKPKVQVTQQSDMEIEDYPDEIA